MDEKPNTVGADWRRLLRDSIAASLEKTDEDGTPRRVLLADAIVDKGISGDVKAFDYIVNFLTEEQDGADRLTVVLKDGTEDWAK